MSKYRPNSDEADFNIPPTGYVAFDATSLKELITERLTDSAVFSDQNYEGSNLNAIIDVIAYTYHTLMFYLNNTSNETLFSEAQIYENINRIVKSLDYKPVGYQTSTLTINAVGTEELAVKTYTIPRYSYIDINGTIFSAVNDITFTKTIAAEQSLTEIDDNVLLYQGLFVEYPEYSATGEDMETLTVVPSDNEQIDHFNIYVYVKEGGEAGTIYPYEKTTSLFFERPTSRAVEVRLNENKRYEVKFGNNITGRKLNEGDIVYIYYLNSSGTVGQISENTVTNIPLIDFTSSQLDSIKSSLHVKGEGIEYTVQSELDNVLVSSTQPSSLFYSGETVENIRENAPKTFNSQYRLVTLEDYENYIKTNFSNFIVDVNAVNNTQYLDTHIKYYYDLGLSNPRLESRVLLNQVQFANSCDFNNIYLYAVPRLQQTSTLAQRNNFLTTAQKELITNSLNSTKTCTSETIIMDPVYVTVDLGLRHTETTLTPSVADNTVLYIVQEDISRANSDDIIEKTISVFKEYFNIQNTKIGAIIDISGISSSILNINGIATFYLSRTDHPGTISEGLSLIVWNPVYDTQDIKLISQNLQLPSFKYPFYNNLEGLTNKIKIIKQSQVTSVLGSTASNTTSTY